MWMSPLSKRAKNTMMWSWDGESVMQEWEGSQRLIALRDLLVLALSLLPSSPCLGSLLAVGIEASLVSLCSTKPLCPLQEDH